MVYFFPVVNKRLESLGPEGLRYLELFGFFVSVIIYYNSIRKGGSK